MGIKRVLHLITHLGFGGAQDNTLLTVKGHARERYEVHLTAGQDYTERMVEQIEPLYERLLVKKGIIEKANSHIVSLRIRDSRKIVDKYANANKKLFMTLPESLALAHEMARRIDQLFPRPEVIIGIANGALMITRVIADDLGLPMKILRIRYKDSRLKYFIRKWRFMADCFSTLYATPLINRPLRWLIVRIRKMEVDIHQEKDDLIAGKPVVIVDDAIGSGRTIISAKNTVKKMGAERVHIATISSYQPRTREKIFQDEPDVLISRELQYFPWSTNNADYPKFLQCLKAQGLQLWR